MDKSENRFYVFGDYRLDVQDQILYKRDEPVQLTNKVFDLLAVLVINNGRVVTKDELMDTVWPDAIVEESNLKTSIHMLRKALGETNGEGIFIQTIPRRGYRFVAEVTGLNGESNSTVIATERQQEIIIEEEIFIDDEPVKELYPVIETPKALPAQIRQESFIGSPKKNRLAFLLIPLFCVLLVVVGAWAVFKSGVFQGASRFSANNVKISRITSNSNIVAAVISNDGKYIAYALLSENKLITICVRQIATGNTTQLFPPAAINIWSWAFSPDGNFVYYILHNENDKSQDGIYQVSIFGGNQRKVISGQISGQLSFSPDGKHFTYKIIDTQNTKAITLYTANADGSDIREVVSYPYKSELAVENIEWVKWSPDGKRLVIVLRKKDPARWTAIEIPTDGKGEKVLIPPQQTRIGSAEWLPDESGLFISAEDPETEQMQLWIYSNGKLQRITNDVNDYIWVSMTKDGDILASRSTNSASMWFVELNGETPRAVPSIEPNMGHFIWAPDGRLITSLYENGQSQLWILNADGTGKQQLTNMVNSKPFNPRITPDGKHIVFGTRMGGVKQLWQIDMNGNNLTKLMDVATRFNRFEITPDGNLIYDIWTTEMKWTLFKKPLKGGPDVPLTDKNIYEWAVSPDGKLLAIEFDNPIPEQRHTIIRPLEGGEEIKSFNFTSDTDLRWTPDGKALLYVKIQPNSGYEILSQPVDGASPAKQLTNFQSERIFYFNISPDGKTLGASRGKVLIDLVMIKINTK